jgi:multidrug transporter EmrE-like cation transporter
MGRGILLGVSNFCMFFFLLQALRHEDFSNASAVAYTLHAVMNIILVSCAGFLIWKERLERTGYMGILLAIAAVFLLNFR